MNTTKVNIKSITIILIILLIQFSINSFGQEKHPSYLGSVSTGFGSDTSPYTGKAMKSYNFAFDIDKIITQNYSIGLRLQFKQTNNEQLKFEQGQYSFATDDWGIYLSYKIHPYRFREKWDFSLGAMLGVNSSRKYNALSGKLPKEEETKYFYGEESRAAFSSLFPISIGYFVSKNISLNLIATGYYVDHSYLKDKFTWNLNFGISLLIN